MRPFPRRVQALLATILVGASVACAPSAEPDSTGGSETRELDPAATLRFARTTPPSQLDPHKSTSVIADWSYLTPLYDRLTQIRPGPEIAPGVATSWEFSPDESTVTFHLRDGVVFHDRARLDAAAVKSSIERAKNVPGSTVARQLSNVVSVEVVDPLTVAFRVNRPSSDLPYVLASPAGALISPKQVSSTDLSTVDAGSGPFELEKLQTGDRVVYKRYADYWDPHAAKVARLEIIGMVDDNARLSSLRSKQIDAMQVQPSQIAAAKRLGEDGDFDHVVPPASAWFALVFNTDMAPLNDVRVRQALNFAVDKNAISKAFFGGMCTPTSQPIQKGFRGYSPEAADAYPFDPDRARQLLAEAGLPQGFQLSVYTGSGLQPHTQIVTAVQDQLRSVGVQVEILQADVRQFITRWAEGKSHAVVQSHTPDASPTLTLSNNYLIKARYPGSVPTELTAAVQATYPGRLPEADRATALQTASRTASTNALDLFLCANPYTWLSTASVVGLNEMPGIDIGTTTEPQFIGLAKQH